MIVKEIENNKYLCICDKCGIEYTINKYEHNKKIKKGLIYCGKCNHKESVKRRTIVKKPDQINGVKIIEHLPLEPKKKRYVIAECPLCKKHYKKRYDALKDHPLCRECGDKKGAQLRTTHGLSAHSLFKRWCGMMSRCHWDKNNEINNKYYKEKGVTVCDEWRNDFKAFYDWSLKNGYGPELELDKDILCDAKGIYPKIYSPETCMWVTKKININYSSNPHNHKKICEICKKEFYGTARQKYCGNECYYKATYKRKKEKR